MTDDQLLRRFVGGDATVSEAAFRVLVERHGPMVLGVCRRVLIDHHAAEDAFQATFLVLIRRAASVARREKLANWLYGVAVRASRESKRRETRRQARERVIRESSATEFIPRLDQADLHSLLDEELNRLPGRYREALVACELEGKSRREAADQLGLPEGTLSSHLARGRKLLRQRLGRRGVDAMAIPWTRLSSELATSSVPATLIESTTRFAQIVLIGSHVDGTIPASVALLVNSMRRTTTMAKLVTTAGTCIAIGALALVGVVLAQPGTGPASPPPNREDLLTPSAIASSDGKSPQTQKPSQAKPAPAQGEVKRSMLVHVLGPDGQPMEGVQVHMGLWTEKETKTPKRDYISDQQGRVRLELPEGIRILRLWSRSKGLVPLYAGWEEEENPDESLPKEFTFQLSSGTAIGGIVQDEEGRPIKGAQVNVKLEHRGQPIGRTGPSHKSWPILDESPTTDAEGRWNLDNVPAGNDVEVSLRLNHPSYIPDSDWGALQHEQGITMRVLRDQTAKIRMRRGIEVTGTVQDPQGKPVPGALVIHGDRPYWEWGSQEIRTDDQGQFHLPSLQPGPRTITVVAPHWMPWLKKIDLKPGLKPLDVHLEPGKNLQLRFLDSKGKPIPGVTVAIDGWRGGESLYNHKHPNVLDTQIPDESNREGLYQWSWAPGDNVEYRFWKDGFAEVSMELTANGREQTVTLERVLRISGRVTDAVTGQPIKQVFAIPVLGLSNGQLMADRQEMKRFSDNSYVIEGNKAEAAYRVRIEAEGYRSAMSGVSHLSGSDVVQDFQLEPAASVQGRILKPNGQPAKDARVYLATPSQEVYLVNNEEGGLPSPNTLTSGEGRFSLPAQCEPYTLLVMHDDGYAELERDPNHQPGDLVLKAWARVEGQVMQGGRPVASVQVNLKPFRPQLRGFPLINIGHWQKTDKAGHFVMDRVPPVKSRLFISASIWSESALSAGHSLPFDIQAGQHIKVDFGGQGTSVKGRVVVAGDSPPIDLHKSLNYLVRKGSGIEAPKAIQAFGFNDRDGWNPAWSRTQEGLAFLNTLDYTLVVLDRDGRFEISGVPVGEYDFAIHLYEPPTEGCLVNPIGSRIVRFSVAGDTAKNPTLDLGEIKVETAPGPRPGDPAPEIDYVDASGKNAKLSSLRGKYVLLDFWATWCAACVENLDALRELQQDPKLSKDLVILGLNFDEDRRKAQSFVQKHDLPWTHGFLGSESAIAAQVQTRYALSSFPTYVLIDPEGKMIGKEPSFETARKLLEQKRK